MDWIPIISTLGGFVIAGISIYLNYKARTSPYREALYSKQLEGCVELAIAIYETVLKVSMFLVVGGSKTKKGKDLYSQITSTFINIYAKYSKWATLLPREISSSVINFTDEIERILNLPFKEENSKLVGNAYMKILDEIRDAIGTEPLGEETLKLIKKIKS